jgi:transposase-like protein
MTRERRHFSSQDKVKILRENLVDHKPISEICEKHEIQPSLFYSWQKTFFENGAAAFEGTTTKAGRVSAEQKKIEKLEAKLQRKDEVMAELLTEHILLKKEIGES